MRYISNIVRSDGDPKVLHSGPSLLSGADRLARSLGWFSIGLGIAELFAAEQMTRALGMEGKEALVRSFGYARSVRASSRCPSTNRPDCGAEWPATASTS